MKVGIYLDTYRPEDGGGYRLQTDVFRSLSKLAAGSRHQFVVISSPNKQSAATAKEAGLGWLPYSGQSLLEKIAAFLSRSFPSLRKRINARTSFERKARAAGVEFLWFLSPRPMEVDLPYVTTVWDLQHRKQPWFPEVSERAEWDTRERRIPPFLRRAAGIIAGTEAGKAEILSFFQIPEERIHILPHPTPSYALEAKGDSNINEGYLLYPAQFWAHKNHVNLLLALKELKDKGVVVPLVLVGSDFGNRVHVEATVTNLGLADQVKFMGFVEAAELVKLYKGAMALVYPSYFGPENLPPLEAFAFGCPVIAARVNGAEEQLGDAAILVDPSKPGEIAGAIRKVQRDAKLRARLVSRGKKRAKRWTTDDFVRGVFDILDGFEPVRRTWKS